MKLTWRAAISSSRSARWTIAASFVVRRWRRPSSVAWGSASSWRGRRSSSVARRAATTRWRRATSARVPSASSVRWGRTWARAWVGTWPIEISVRTTGRWRTRHLANKEETRRSPKSHSFLLTPFLDTSRYASNPESLLLFLTKAIILLVNTQSNKYNAGNIINMFYQGFYILPMLQRSICYT